MSDDAKILPFRTLEMLFAPKEAKRRLVELQAFVQAAMVKDVDFYRIGNDPKRPPSLSKSGAEKLAELYGLSWALRFIEGSCVRDWTAPFFAFEAECILSHRATGAYIGNGVGSCNSKEDKYAWRWVFDREAKAMGLDLGKLKTREGTGRNGKPYTLYRAPNDDPFSLVNTMQKIAQKRAFVAAVISATQSSGLFTQDAEDLPPEAYGHAEPTRPWERGERAPSPQADVEPTPATGPAPDSPPAIDVFMNQALASTDYDGDKAIWVAATKHAKDHPGSISRKDLNGLRDLLKASGEARARRKAPPPATDAPPAPAGDSEGSPDA